jgi:hypothetical protein
MSKKMIIVLCLTYHFTLIFILTVSHTEHVLVPATVCSYNREVSAVSL